MMVVDPRKHVAPKRPIGRWPCVTLKKHVVVKQPAGLKDRAPTCIVARVTTRVRRTLRAMLADRDRCLRPTWVAVRTCTARRTDLRRSLLVATVDPTIAVTSPHGIVVVATRCTPGGITVRAGITSAVRLSSDGRNRASTGTVPPECTSRNVVRNLRKPIASITIIGRDILFRGTSVATSGARA